MKIINLGNEAVNNWLIEKGNRRILIDTGYKEDYPAFLRHLDALHLSPKDLTAVFLTHAHDDHAGFLKALLTDAPTLKVIASALAKPGLRRGQNGPGGGAPDENAIGACIQMIKDGHGAHRFPKFEPSDEARFVWVTSNSRSEAEAALGGQIVALPGHTNDSIGLVLDDCLFCGDAAQNRPNEKLKTTIWIGDIAAYAESWQKMINLPVKTIYPGHGAPFDAAILAKQLPDVKKITLLKMPRIKH